MNLKCYRKTYGFSTGWVVNSDTNSTSTEEHGSAEIIRKKEYKSDDIRNAYIQYAYDLWWRDLVAVMECENATRNMHRQSEVVKNGRREPSYWFCMIDRDFHQKIVDDPRFREDWRWQIEQCARLRKWWTKFYAPERWIAKAWMKCSEYVKDRFEFI